MFNSTLFLIIVCSLPAVFFGVLLLLLPFFVWRIRECLERCERLLAEIAGHRASAPKHAGAVPGPARYITYRQQVLDAASIERPSAEQEQYIQASYRERVAPLAVAERLTAD